MKRIIALTTLVLILLVVGTASPIIRSVKASPYLDPVIASAWSTSSPSTILQAVLVLNHIPTSADALAIQGYSKTTEPLTQLPMILTVTNYGNLTSILNYPGIVSVWANRQLTYYGNVNTVTHSSGEVPVQHSWWNDVMRVPDAWSLGFQGQGITVALIDTGIDASNPSLGYNFPNGLSLAPFRVIQNVKVADIGELVSDRPLGPDQVFLENQITTDTSSGHGTSTAGLVAGTGDASNGIYKGAAPRAHLVGLGAGDIDFIFFAVAAFDYIIAHQAQYNIRIVSNSWGTDFNCSDNFGNPTNDCAFNTPIQQASKAAHDHGIAVFFAAGNSGPGHPTLNPFAEPPWVVGVGAGTQSKGLTDFSSRGIPGNASVQPSLVTPGLNVITTKSKTGPVDNTLSTSPDSGNIVTPLQLFYTTFAGTSAATPLAAGVAALVLSAANLTPDQLKATMTQTTDPMLGYLPFQVGTGYVNALNAIKAAQGLGFKPTTTRVQAFGDQRFIYTQFIGGEVAITDDWLDGNFPVFQGARSININASFPGAPATPLEWQLNGWGPNDQQVVRCRTSPLAKCSIAVGATSVVFTISNATLIASLNNPGFNAGTWTIQVINFGTPTTTTLTVDIQYPARASTQLKNAHDVEVDDSQPGGLQGSEESILQTWAGTITGTLFLAQAGTTTVTTQVTQATNTVISVVQVVVVDSTGTIVEVRGAFVTTQADLNARAQQIQQLLLTTTDPTQVSTLQTELSAIQAALPGAPLTETLPVLP